MGRIKDIAIALDSLTEQDWADARRIMQLGGVDPARWTSRRCRPTRRRARAGPGGPDLHQPARKEPRITQRRCVRLALAVTGRGAPMATRRIEVIIGGDASKAPEGVPGRRGVGRRPRRSRSRASGRRSLKLGLGARRGAALVKEAADGVEEYTKKIQDRRGEHPRRHEEPGGAQPGVRLRRISS
jgi:hypothetical protein